MAAKYDVRTSSDGQYYFNLKAANGKVILTSERYTTKANALNGIRSIQENTTVAARFDRRTSKARDPYFVLKAGNGEPIGRSEMYSSTGARDNGIRSVEANAPTARVNDLTDSSTHVANITGHVQAPVSTEREHQHHSDRNCAACRYLGRSAARTWWMCLSPHAEQRPPLGNQ